jgi:hypothetical protein
MSTYAKLTRKPSHLSSRESASALYDVIRDSNPFLNLGSLEDPALIYGHPSDRLPSSPETERVDRSPPIELEVDKSVNLDGFSYLGFDSGSPGGTLVGSEDEEEEPGPLRRFADHSVENAHGHHEYTASIPVESKPSPLEDVVNGYQGLASSSTPEDEFRKPSYEGTAYGTPTPPVPTKEIRSRPRPTRIPSPIQIPVNETTRRYHPLVEKAARRIPSPIQIPTNDTTPRRYHPIVEKAVQRANSTASLGSPPPLPPKNPMRLASRGHLRGSDSSVGSGVPELGNNVLRIVSKENIRAALSMNDLDESLSLDPSSPDPTSPGDRTAFAGIGGRGLNTGESPKISTYNRHMFPRVGSSPPPIRYGGMDGGNGNYELGVIGEKDNAEEDTSIAFL